MDAPFIMQQLYNVPVAKVWQALTDADQMRVWYFNLLKRFEPLIGFKFEFNHDGSAYQKEWTLTQISDQKLLAHSWSYSGFPGVSEVIFELFEAEGKTLLQLTHTGIERFPDEPHFPRNRFGDGWAHTRDQLKSIPGRQLKNFKICIHILG